MKIGILIAGLSPYGAERAAARLAEGFNKYGEDVRVFLTDTESEIPLNVPVISMLHGKKLNLFQKFLYAPVQYFRLHRALKQEKFDVLISFMERANIFNLLLPGSYRKVLTIRTFLSSGLKINGILRRIATKIIYKLLLHRADMVGFVSKAATEDFQQLFSIADDKVEVFHNPVYLDEITERVSEELEPEYVGLFDENTIAHLGRFTADKGQWYLIRALPIVLETIPDARLVLIGDGPNRDYLQNLVNELKLDHKVHFLGFQNNPVKFISRAGVVACSSTREGFPNALVEALASNAAIVSTDCKSGPRELLAPDTEFSLVAQDIERAKYGILTPPFDGELKKCDEPLTSAEKFMAKALVEMMKDKSLSNHYRQISMQRIEEFMPDRIIKKWIEAIRAL